MRNGSARKEIIEKLYEKYKADGFITEDEALDCFATHDISLTYIDSITDQLLSMGVIIKTNDIEDNGEDDIYDRTRTDYEKIFADILKISPELVLLIDYIKTIKPPQFREWHILIPQAQNGNEYAYERVFEMYLRVVIKIALDYHIESGYEIDDIVQVGAMGLLRAIKAYDFSKHGSFVSYMPLWITQYISRAIADLSRSIRLPVHMYETIRRIERTYETLQSQLEKEPTNLEVAEVCNLAEDDVVRILNYKENTISIEEFLSIEDDGYCSYELFDSEEFKVEDFIEQNDLHRLLIDLLNTLSKREADIIVHRFGFFDDTPKTLEEIGELYGVTRERIRQIESKALRKLKHPSRIKKLKGF